MYLNNVYDDDDDVVEHDSWDEICLLWKCGTKGNGNEGVSYTKEHVSFVEWNALLN